MRETTRNFLVGIASIIALLGLAYLLFLFGELDRWVHPRFGIHLDCSDAHGLRPGATVEFNGVPVGIVDSVYVQQHPTDPVYPVRVELLVDAAGRIPENFLPSAEASLLGGSPKLQLQIPAGTDLSTVGYLSKDRADNRIARSIAGGNLLEQVTATLDERMRPLLGGLDSFNTLSAKYIELGDNLNAMFATQSSEAIGNGEPPNLRTAIGKLNAALDDVRASLDLARQWLGDEQLRADAKSAIEKAKTLIDNATTAVDRYTKLAESLQTDTKDLTNRLLPVVDNLSATLEDVRRLTKAAADGKGTVAQMLNNPDLYNSLNDAAIRLERALAEAQLLIQKIKAEGLPVKF